MEPVVQNPIQENYSNQYIQNQFNQNQFNSIQNQFNQNQTPIQFNQNQFNQNQFNQTQITRPKLTRFERCRVVGARATQLAMGAEPLINTNGKTDPLDIAEMELTANKIPMIIRRYLPNGTYEDWNLQDLN